MGWGSEVAGEMYIALGKSQAATGFANAWEQRCLFVGII